MEQRTAGMDTGGWPNGPAGLRQPLLALPDASRRDHRDLAGCVGLAGCLGRSGSLELYLAATPDDIRKAQALRHRVFFRDRAAGAAAAAGSGHDQDAFDALCDHLLVIDGLRPGRPVVGTYRLLRQDVAGAADGFYSAGEFAIAPLLARHRHLRFLELGRSCVLPDYRDRRTIALLWQGLWQYVQQHDIGCLFGCASFDGTDPAAHALPLSFLFHEARATPAWQANAAVAGGATFSLLPRERIDQRAALRALPPLIRGYLRTGARFSDDVVIDTVFGTTDVFVVMPTAAIHPRYIDYFGASSDRCAA